MQKIVYANDFEQPPGITNLGGFNEMPQPFKEIDINQYIRFTHNTPQYLEYRQVYNLPNYNTMRVVNISWYHNYGIAVLRPLEWKIQEGKIIYTEPFRYFLLGCDHQWEETDKSRGFDHHYRCKLCKTEEWNNSSD